MLRKKQLVVIASVIALMTILLSMDIKGLVKPKENRQAAGMQAESAPAAEISIESISGLAKQEISAGQLTAINELEASLNAAPASEKLAIVRKLAAKWGDLNKFAPAALYEEQLAEAENTYAAWLKAGDNFTEAYQNVTDSLLQPGLVGKAINAYQQALAKDSTGLDARTGLGIAYVSGSMNPMQGIQLLKGVTDEDPKNVKANTSLGLFSIKTGQFDKAIERFKTVLSVKEGPEAWFYLASCYESLGQKQEAINAYLKSKELAADPGLSRYVDQKVGELSK
jgi:tetratricopeptide (TPR) repeat protein